MEDIKFSFIMAAYNAEKYIDCAIKSVLNQSYPNWELMVVNDGSLDSTEQIVKEYEKEDVRVKLITIEHSGTASKARNVALDYLSGEYVQMLDSDDYISEDLLECYYKKLKDTKYDILVPDAVCITDDLTIIWEKKPILNNYDQELNGEIAFMYSLDWRIHGIFLVKSNILKKFRYDPELINGDEFTTRKLFFNSDKISYIKGVYYYRKNLESTTLSNSNRVRMFECLTTDVNIYNYSVENKMFASCIKLTGKKLIKSVVSYQLKFEKMKHDLDSNDYQRIEAILKEAYQVIRLKMLFECKCLHSLLMLLSFKSYKIFCNEIKIITRIK